MVKTHGSQMLTKTFVLGLSLLLGSAKTVGAGGGSPEENATVVAEKVKVVGQQGVVLNKTIATSQQALAANPNDQNAATRLAQAKETRRAGDQFMGESAARFPDSFVVQNAAAGAAVSEENYQAALGFGQRAVDLAGSDPAKLPAALKDLALAQNKTGDFENAALTAKRGVDLKPADKQLAYDLMGLYQDSTGRAAAAAHDAKANAFAKGLSGAMKPSSLTPQSLPAATAPGASPTSDAQTPHRLQIANSIRESLSTEKLDPAAALRSLEKAEALLGDDSNPLAGTVHDRKSDVLVILKDFARALVEITKAISVWANQGKIGNLARANTKLAAIYNDKDPNNSVRDPQAAEAAARAALKADHNYPPAHIQHARALEDLGRHAEAEAELLAAKQLDDELNTHYDASYKDGSGPAALGAADKGGASRSWSERLRSAGRFKTIVGAAGVLLFLVAAYIFVKGNPIKRFKELTTSSGKTEPNARVPAAKSDGDLTIDGGRYELGEIIGQGGMGTVRKAKDTALNRFVAVKSLNPELQTRPRERARFIAEALAVARLHHPHIVQIFTVINEAEDTYIVYEHLDGHTMHDELNKWPNRRLDPRLAIDLLRQTAEAADHAHEFKIIHRDLKPSNVMLVKIGGKLWVKVMDFGIAREMEDILHNTTTNTIVGTPSYMAPEQERGVVCKQSDVWALGVMAYEMITGSLPFGSNDTFLKLEKRPGRFTSISGHLPGMPPALDAVFEKALDPDPTKRHQFCTEFVHDFETAILQPTPPRA